MTVSISESRNGSWFSSSRVDESGERGDRFSPWLFYELVEGAVLDNCFDSGREEVNEKIGCAGCVKGRRMRDFR